MKNIGWYTLVIGSLTISSLITYLLQIIIFKRPQETFFYFFQDLAFVPMQVLLVTLVLNEWLSRREKRLMLSKMNMVIGVFFSEVGTSLLKIFSSFDLNTDAITKYITTTRDWDENALNKLEIFIKKHNILIDKKKHSIKELHNFLLQKREFLLRLLENPNLLEHDTFTELLWAVFHLAEELSHRQNIDNLSDADFAHLSIDIKRAYVLLLSEWLAYLKHLKCNYPFIFSLVLRTNPFDKKASVEIKELS